jgi:hypothetical protein
MVIGLVGLFEVLSDYKFSRYSQVQKSLSVCETCTSVHL